jgi:two-component sensor histidine kinase
MLDMIQRALIPFREKHRERFTISGNDAILNANQALLLGMTMHELATNAVKYGALSNAQGTVDLSWRISPVADGRILKLEWREQGGPSVNPPGRKGFGSTLIERAVQQERGKSCFEFRPEGVVCSLEMKI